MQVVQLLESRKNKLELIALPFPFPDNAVMNTTNPPTYLPTYLHTYLPTTYQPTYPPTNIPTYLPTYLPTTYQPTYLLTYRPTYLFTYLPYPTLPTYLHYLPTNHLPTYLPTHLPTNIPTHLPTYRPTNLPISFRETTRSYFQLATRTTQSFSAPLSATNKELETKKLTADRAVDGRGGIEEEGTVDRVIGGRGTELESTVWGRGWVNVDWRVEQVRCLKAQQKYCAS